MGYMHQGSGQSQQKLKVGEANLSNIRAWKTGPDWVISVPTSPAGRLACPGHPPEATLRPPLEISLEGSLALVSKIRLFSSSGGLLL